MSRLHRAVRYGNVEEVSQLLAQGETVDAFSVHGFTPLMLAAQQGHLFVVQLLLEAGANVTLTHRNQRTALHFAATGGHAPIVETLVVAGSDVNARSAGGNTPALDAAQMNHRVIVDYLGNHGADLNIQDRRGHTATDWLAIGGLQGHLTRTFPSFPITPEAMAHAEAKIRELMLREPSAEAFAAKHGRNTLVWSYGQYPLTDAAAQWAKRVSEIISSPELLTECEEKHLTGAELEEARTSRKRREKARQRQKRSSPI